MNTHNATEQAYKNGYDKGMEDAVKSGYAHRITNAEEPTTSCNPLCHSKTWMAYNRLLNALHDDDATKMDLRVAIADAIKLLGDTPA